VNKPRILVVEDEAVVASDIHLGLVELGYEPVGHAMGGEQAIILAGERRPDLVLVDLQLAGAMDGIAVAHAIRAQFSLPVVFLTAFAEDDTLAGAGLTEPFGYLLNPFSGRELRTVIEMALYKHKAEARLRESEALCRTLFDQSPDGVLIVDAQTTRPIMFNDVACRQLGYSREEFARLRISDYEAAEAPEVIKARVGRLLGDGRDDFETKHRGKTGDLRDVLVTVQRSELSGRPALHVIFRDITERKRAEEALARLNRQHELILCSAAEGILGLDAQGNHTFVNPATERMLGYEPDELLGRHSHSLWHHSKPDGSPYPGEECQIYSAYRDGKVHRESGEVFWRKDGTSFPVEYASTPIYEHGRLTGAVVTFTDITERLELEAQFRQAQKMESVGQLASGIAHDFNNLLTVINGTAELLLAQVSQDDPVRADVQEISCAGERAATLTRQLLAFSRQQILEPRVLTFNIVVAGMESLLRRLLGEDIDLVVVRAPGLGHVKADPGQLEQVITNLVVNARDAMPRGGRLTLETENVEIDEAYARAHGEAVPPGSYVRLTVSDSGVGMNEATRARIFEPFFTTKGPSLGTGLGLSTVFGIVKQSRGFIWVYSEVGHGTSIQICLPRVTEPADTDRPRPTAVSSSGTETILLVEDNAGLRKLATRVLTPAGYTVLGAATGEEALAVLEGHDAPVHLLLTDVVMPGMSGRALAERLAGTHPAMKVLYMSGYTADTVVRHGVLEAQMPFLHKPFTAAALLREVREVLDSPA
jgi:PAS domain S-box-containing protein